MKKILITGASGFVGGYLINHLDNEKQYELYGTYNHDFDVNSSLIKDKINLKKIDLLNYPRVLDLLSEIKPDYIFHLAGAASPARSFINPAETLRINIDTQLNILEAIRELSLINTGMMIISSSEVYGKVLKEDLPVDENTPLKPASPYAVSKLTQDFLGLQYFLTYNLNCIRVRPFNHIGPRQKLKFVVSDFSRQIARIEKGEIEPTIRVGNLDARKDFTDVRDIVRAYSLLMDKGIPGEVYNIGSGIGVRVKEILDILLDLASCKIITEIDPDKMRPGDIPEVVCDNSRLSVLTGWKPEITLRKTLQDTLDYWRSIV